MTGDSNLDVNSVPLNETIKIGVELLKLDRLNPRLMGVNEATSEEGVIAQLYRAEDLGELLQSIAANGYLDIEPLIVWLAAGDDHLTVLEGNRRLAAIRLFLEPELSERIATQERQRIALPAITEATLSTLATVSVYRVPDREAARSFIGFKHINGAAKWESYAKAKFAAEWYRSGDISLEEISNKIGDRHDTIKRMVAAIYVLDQAESNEIFSLSDRNTTRFNFSHLYTALSRKNYLTHLGLDTSWSKFDPEPNPIPAEKLDHLRELLVWLYGSRSERTDPVVQSQNPDIKHLGESLATAEGLHILRAGRTLQEAHASTRPAEETLSAALLRARSTLREAANSLRGYDGKDHSLLDIAADVSETAQIIHDRMDKKYKTAMGEEGDG